MQFTGTELSLKRNFYTQTGQFGFNLNCIVDNTSGQYLLGVSGSQSNSVLEFRLESGKIYYGNQFLHTYQANQPFFIEADFSSGATNIIKDNAALVYGKPKSTGYFDYFYIKRANNGMGATLNLNISGNNIANFAIQYQAYLLSSGQNAVTGYFTNNSVFPLRIFDSNILATQNYSFGKLAKTINGQASGQFAYTGDFTTIDTSQPILTTFNTNFQDAVILFSIIDVRTYNRFVFLTAPIDFTFNQTGILSRAVSYINYSGGLANNGFNTSLTFQLSYVSGSGYFTGLQNYSTPGIGRFNQSGLLTGAVSTVTGNFYVNQFNWATGAATGIFSGIGTGWATGLGYTGFGTGWFTGYTTGYIYDGSGVISGNFYDTGRAFGVVMYNANFATGYVDFTNFISGSTLTITGSDQLFTFNVRSPTSNPYSTPNCDGSGNYWITGISQITGFAACLSGYSPIRIVVTKTIGNVFLLKTLVGGFSGNNAGIISSWGNPGDGNFISGIDSSPIPGITVYPTMGYTGYVYSLIIGSGIYTGYISGAAGIPYIKSFTGQWDLLTGVDDSHLASLKISGQYNSTMISGSGIFPANSQISLQITHNIIDSNLDECRLIISGNEVLNGINKRLVN